MMRQLLSEDKLIFTDSASIMVGNYLPSLYSAIDQEIIIFTMSLPFPTSITEITDDNETIISINKTSKYSNYYDRVQQDREENIYSGYLWDLYTDIDAKHNGEMIDGNLRINSYATELWADYFQSILIGQSLPLYCIAATITLIYATYDIGSFFLSFAALWEVAVTLPYTWFFYNFVFGIDELGNIQLAVIFILFAVGIYYYPAYVFVDHWLHTTHIVEDRSDFKTRLSIAWKQAAASAGVAQSTTFISFLSALMGTILLFKAFGVFAAVAIGINYILGITLFPCSIIIWELYVRDYEHALAIWCRGHGVLRYLAFDIDEKYYQRFKTQTMSKMPTMSIVRSSTLTSWKAKSERNLKKGLVDIGYGLQTLQELKSEYRKFGVFVGVYWTNFLHKTSVKIIVTLISIIWFIITFWSMTHIKPLEENEDFNGDDTYLTKSLYEMNSYTSSKAMRNNIRILYGINGIKSKSRNVWREDFGEIDYNDINIHSYKQQEYLLYFCDEIRNYTSTINNEILITDNGDVECIMESFKNYIEGMNLSYPLIIDSNDTNIEKQYYLSKLYEFYHLSTEGIEWRNKYLMDITLNTDNNEYSLKYFSFGAISIYDFWSLQSSADREEENWREFIIFSRNKCKEELNSNDNLCSPRYTSIRMAWSEGYSGYFSSATNSILTSIPIILIILAFVLNNWIMAVFCVLNVICIMTSVLGIIGFIGWRFGLTECASVVLVIGFSVDYCVHIAHGYIVAPLKDCRKHRMQFALMMNGHAILSSAIVSLLSTIPILINKQQILFWKMGILTSLTIIFSVIYCFSIFSLLLATLAPQGNTGKIFGRKKISQTVQSHQTDQVEIR